jgi:murein DD-endopeptidase MepM/ murein hydrolase activator NlpD
VAYRPPVPVPIHVLRSFDPPATPFGPGHLGVDLALPEGQPVLSAAAGTVTFAGPVAGRGVVVVAHADGVRTEYEPLTPSVRRGVEVAAGTPLGLLTGVHPGCPSAGGGDCLHWGARRGEAYLDPLSLLAPLAPVRLLPWRA